MRCQSHEGHRDPPLRVVVPALAVGGALAAANAVGRGWGAAVAVAVIMTPVAVVNYMQAGGDSDRAAMMIGGGADERQALIRRRAMARSGVVMYAAALISGIAVIAVRGVGHWSTYWPIGLVVVAGPVGYLVVPGSSWAEVRVPPSSARGTVCRALGVAGASAPPDAGAARTSGRGRRRALPRSRTRPARS
jgi:hypothetical protein